LGDKEVGVDKEASVVENKEINIVEEEEIPFVKINTECQQKPNDKEREIKMLGTLNEETLFCQKSILYTLREETIVIARILAEIAKSLFPRKILK